MKEKRKREEKEEGKDGQYVLLIVIWLFGQKVTLKLGQFYSCFPLTLTDCVTQ